MKISRVEAIPVVIPVRAPLEMAVATVRVRTCVVVRVTTDDGVCGIGEAVLARYFSGESPASALDLIGNEYVPVLVGREASAIAEIRALMRRISVYNPGARAAVEMALHDVVAAAPGCRCTSGTAGRAATASRPSGTSPVPTRLRWPTRPLGRRPRAIRS